MTLNTQSLSCLAQVRAFLDGNAEVGFSPPPQADRHAWLAATLRQFRYGTLKRPDKGLVRAFALKVTGYSRAQLTRLIRQFQRNRRIMDRRGPPAQPFARRYTEAAVRSLVTLDRLHGQLSGPATRKLAERAFKVFNDQAYERLATISLGHLYNVRASAGYRHLCYPLDQMNTSYAKLKAIPDVKRFLKPKLTFEELDKQACAMTDNQAAEQLNQQRTKLFKHIQSKHAD